MAEELDKEQQYHMPAEWEKHEGTWLQWPHDGIFDGYQMRMERIWLVMVEALHQHENVHIIVRDERQRDHVAYLLRYFNISEDTVHLYVIPTNDVWVRDNGPIYVLDSDNNMVIANWEFNGWGNRFEGELDNNVPSLIGESLSIPVVSPPLVLEGGAVEVNGKGTFMATRSSIINDNRNPGKSQEEVEAILSKYLGVTHFIWLSGAGGEVIEEWGGVTDSHIDGAARFTDESTVLYSWNEDRSDPHFNIMLKHYEELKEAVTESGKPLTLVPAPLPEGGVHQISSNLGWRKSTLTAAIYVNFYVANGVVLAPVYGNKNDARAKAVISEHFPGREVIGIDSAYLSEHGGMIHCVTQQQPAVKRA